MKARLKKLAVTLTITIIFFSFTQASIKITFSDDVHGKIDLFTQKEPYSGKGPNMASDAFGPGELVVLYALVTHEEVPLQNLLVTFYVQVPDDTSFSLTTRTNACGIATTSFAIPQKCGNESEIFGEWLVLANVLIDGEIFQDTLVFEVNWVVKLVSVRTIDENLTYQTNFGIEGDVGLEIALRSIAMIIKSATLAIVIQDELEVAVNSLEISDFEVQPNEKLIFLYCKLCIPKWAHVGKAMVLVSAFTGSMGEGEVPYCPAISAEFFIMPYEPLTIVFHDVAVVNAVPSAKSVELSQLVDISVDVRNEGTEDESFSVSAYCDDVLIETLKVTALTPYSETTLSFTLETSLIDAGIHTITVSIPYLVNEADLTDNTFVNGVIEIKPKPPTVIHDIAIVEINVSNNSVYIGELLQINVSVVNKGNETETFDVETYYDFSSIGTLRVSALTPGAQVTLIFVWNTSLVHEDFYQIKASAPLPSDVNISDNTLVYGIVRVMARPPLPPTHDVAVLSVLPSKTLVYTGEVVSIYIVVQNEGSYVESFDVTAFYSPNAVGKLSVKSLQPGSEMSLVFYWNTLNVTEGNYTLSAVASAVPGELNIENNKFVDDVVWIKPRVFPAAWEIPRSLLALLFLLAVFTGACLVAAIVFALLWTREKKKKRQMDTEPNSPEGGFKGSKTCGVCGKEFLGAYTFCPYCLTFHGKDYG